MLDSHSSNYALTTKVVTDENENLVLDFPDELLDVLGWKEGDELEIQIFAGRLIFRRVEKGSPDESDSNAPD